MQLIMLFLFGLWLYSVWSLMYIPFKIAAMKRNSQDIWTFLSGRRLLLLSMLAYLASALSQSFVVLALEVGGVSGSGRSAIPDYVGTIGLRICWVFLAAAAIALIFIFKRPRPETA